MNHLLNALAGIRPTTDASVSKAEQGFPQSPSSSVNRVGDADSRTPCTSIPVSYFCYLLQTSEHAGQPFMALQSFIYITAVDD